MKKKGFTYIELMIAISIFAILVLMIMRLNITSENNLNSQIANEKMILVAQQQMEKYKSTLPNIGIAANIGAYPNGFVQDNSGYYIVVRGDNTVTDNTNVYLVTVWVRKSSTDSSTEIKLQSHEILK